MSKKKMRPTEGENVVYVLITFLHINYKTQNALNSFLIL